MTVKKHSGIFLRERGLSERNCCRNELATTVVETKSADIYTRYDRAEKTERGSPRFDVDEKKKKKLT